MQLERENHSDKNTKKGFSYYKSKLDIAEFLRAKGNDIGKNYFVEHKESTRTNPKFKKYNAEGVHIDTIGIYLQKQKNHAAYYFVKSWDAAYDKSALSIYDFLIQELGLEGQPNSLIQVHEMLKKFDEDGKLYISDTINLAFDNNNSNSAIDKFKQYNTVEKYSNFTYLQQRGLSESCLLYTSPSPRDRTRYRMQSSA